MDVDALDDDLLAAGGRKRSQEAQEDELGTRRPHQLHVHAPPILSHLQRAAAAVIGIDMLAPTSCFLQR